MKCQRCHSCLQPRAIENKLYLVCYLCKKFYLLNNFPQSGTVIEITDEEIKKRLASYLEFGVIE